VEILYTVWVKIDETLPWIELKGKYLTRREAKKAAKDVQVSLRTKIVELPERRNTMKPLGTMRVTR
jgi:hypothetical protein